MGGSGVATDDEADDDEDTVAFFGFGKDCMGKLINATSMDPFSLADFLQSRQESAMIVIGTHPSNVGVRV